MYHPDYCVLSMITMEVFDLNLMTSTLKPTQIPVINIPFLIHIVFCIIALQGNESTIMRVKQG